ncbi:MAG: hypothetical protein K0Q95_722 [Bacteroidota bacterium]|jgi:hypothetical protein|nr:hypothetical protein [Bacteroidota bacterium]
MKRICCSVLGLLLIGNITFAQKIQSSDVPQSILNTFHNAYLNAENPQWEMDYDNYEVKFKNNKAETTTTYNKDGKWMKTETQVSRSSMPDAVKESLSKEFDSYNVNDIERVDKPDGVSYLIDLEYKQVNYIVSLTEKGDVISKDEAKEYKKD